MKLVASIANRERTVEIGSDGLFLLDGRSLEADVALVEPGVYSVLVGACSYELRVREGAGGVLDVHVNGRHYAVSIRDPRRLGRARGGLEREGRQEIMAPMPGKVVRLLVSERQKVEAGQGLLVVEAMKMQNEIRSPKAGTVAEIRVAEGAPVGAGQALVVVE